MISRPGVDAGATILINSDPEATSSSVLGPFHVSNPPALPIGGDLRRDFEGTVLLVEGHVRDKDGKGIAGAGPIAWAGGNRVIGITNDPADAQNSILYGYSNVGPTP